MEERFTEFSDLVGKTIATILLNDSNDELTFVLDDGTEYKMYHERNCCETVCIEDINGDLDDLIGSPIIMAREVSNYTPTDERAKIKEKVEGDDLLRWTFYSLATMKGFVDIRWFGTSNGYYSVGVDFIKVGNDFDLYGKYL